MKDFMVLGGFLVFWIVLNRWLLPYFGIQTCMSGACSRPPQTQSINLGEKAEMKDETIHQTPKPLVR